MVNAVNYARPVWIVFTKRVETVCRICQLVTTPEFNHVYCIVETSNGIMRVDGDMAGITLHEFHCTWEQYITHNVDNITDVIRVDVDRGQYWKCLRGAYTCVSVAKAVALLKTPWYIITPKQLHGWLKNDKATRSKTKHA